MYIEQNLTEKISPSCTLSQHGVCDYGFHLSVSVATHGIEPNWEKRMSQIVFFIWCPIGLGP